MSTNLLSTYRRLRNRLAPLTFAPPVTHVYQPLDYAWEPHREYLERWGGATGRVVLLGMNPGPFGMAQTGVPFGDVVMVTEWLGIEGRVGRPAIEHPKRPVEGFACRRREGSGRRFWGWARSRFGTPERFFERFFVLNYCPLLFLEESGRNRTPDKLPAEERRPLLVACDAALVAALSALEPRLAVGIGRFAEARLETVDARKRGGKERLPVACILHPSPANPLANASWEATIEAQLADLGVEI
jgi:single-strand selective monofunctional uracil DNA glycosylase